MVSRNPERIEKTNRNLVERHGPVETRSVQVQNLVEFRDKLALVGAGTATGREDLLAEIRIDTGCGARMGGTG